MSVRTVPKRPFDVELTRQRLFASICVDDGTECWEWKRDRFTEGYGRLKVQGKAFLAHRVSAHVFLDFDLASPLCVLHKCDNPPCINPEHLFIGTQTDNIRDMIAKGRARSGVALPHGFNQGIAHPQARLTDDDVRAIRQMSERGHSLAAIAKRFGITKMHVSNIRRRLAWSHLP